MVRQATMPSIKLNKNSISHKKKKLYITVAAQKRLRDVKSKISSQSKKNFVLERDVRYLDSRIALLIQNRMAADEVSETRAPSLVLASVH